MSIIKYKDRIEYFDYLVRHQLTGTPKECAKKLGLSKSRFYEFLEELKLIDVPIEYCCNEKCFKYKSKGKIIFDFKLENPLNNEEMNRIKGGFSIFNYSFSIKSENTGLTYS